MPSIRLIKRKAIPKCGSYEIRFPDGRPSRFIYLAEMPTRRLRPDMVDSAVAECAAKIFARVEQRRQAPSKMTEADFSPIRSPRWRGARAILGWSGRSPWRS
jgi:hypothetical protein